MLGGAADSTLYNVTAGKTWEISSAFEGFVAPETANLYVDILQEILGDFNLKSSDVGADTNIVISMTGTKINVALYYIYIYDAATSDLTNTSYLISE